MKRVKVFSPRRQPIVLELEGTKTFADARARIRQEFKTPGTSDVLLLHGEMMEDSETVGNKLTNEEEVLYFMEVLAPPKPATAPAANPFTGMGAGRGRGAPGQGGGATAENLANILMQMQQRQQRQGGGGAGQPARQAAAGGANAAPRQQAGARPARPAQQQQPQQQQVPPALVSQLTEMGFSESKAKRALMLNNFDVLDAINWLSEHADDPDVEMTPAGQPSAPAAAPAAAPPPQQPSEAVLRLLSVFDPVLKAIALVAHGEGGLRGTLETVRLPAMEADGWKGFSAAVLRLWGGEREEAALVASLDANTAALVRKVLEYARMPAAALKAAMDRNARVGLPMDPDFDKIEAQMQPMLRRLATMAVQQAKMAMGEGEGCPAEEEKAIMDFVTQMEGANWQLRTPLEMLSAGVRTEEDLMECIAPLASGKPDDKSTRLALSVMAMVLQMEQGG